MSVELEVLHCDNHVLATVKPAGVACVPDDSGDESLLDRARAWAAADPDATTRQELERIVTEVEAGGDPADLADRFDGTLEFGTAGLRGALGADHRDPRGRPREVEVGGEPIDVILDCHFADGDDALVVPLRVVAAQLGLPQNKPGALDRVAGVERAAVEVIDQVIVL